MVSWMWKWLTSDAAGNFGQMLGSVLTGASVLLAVYLLLREVRSKERQQPDKLVAWITPVGPKSTLHVLNTSEQPIIHPTVMLTKSGLWRRFLRNGIGGLRRIPKGARTAARLISLGALNQHVLNANAAESVDMPIDDRGIDYSCVLIQFQDAAGKTWNKEILAMRPPKYRSSRFASRIYRSVSEG
jgi:hypothetical protein